MRSTRAVRQFLSGAAILATVLAVPLLWRPILHVRSVSDERPSYLPALEASRARYPFGDDVASDLRRYPPGLVTIGDSMAGRIDGDRLQDLSGEAVSPLVLNSTGSAYWYFVFKNHVVASGTRPTWVFVFFRDTNLTDVMFRLDGPYRVTVNQVAHDIEPELNAVVARRTRRPWQAVHQIVEGVYETRRLQEWLTPALNGAPAGLVAPGRADKLLEAANRAFALEKLRPMAQADLEAADASEADFASHVEASVLPPMLDLARDHQLRLCFVRVLRRPVDGGPPPESPALQHYVKDLRRYIETHGAVLLDDRDDPALARIPYADGDHIDRDARRLYTDRFWAHVSRLPR